MCEIKITKEDVNYIVHSGYLKKRKELTKHVVEK